MNYQDSNLGCCFISSSDFLKNSPIIKPISTDIDLKNLLDEYSCLFDRLGKTTLIEHKIFMKDASNPLVVRQHRIPMAFEKALDVAI